MQIVLGIIIFPQQIENFSEAKAKQPKFRRRYVASGDREHVIICGHLSGSTPLLRFFCEIFSDSQRAAGESMICAVLLHPGDPSPGIELFVKQFAPFIIYIDGSCTDEGDLKRVDAKNAKAIFMMDERDSEGVAEGDEVATQDSQRIMLSGMSIVSYLHNEFGIEERLQWPELVFQLKRRVKKFDLFNLGVHNVIATNEFFSCLKTVGALVPGFLAFFNNAILSGINNDGIKYKSWMQDYVYGAKSVTLFHRPGLCSASLAPPMLPWVLLQFRSLYRSTYQAYE